MATGRAPGIPLLEHDRSIGPDRKRDSWQFGEARGTAVTRQFIHG